MADFVKTSQVKLNPANPRIIRDEKYRKLVQSVAQFPAMLDVRGIVVDGAKMILGGNQRWRAILDIVKMSEQELRQACSENQAAMTLWEVIREKKAVPANWILDASQFTEDEIRRFIIADNVEFGEHDWDALANGWDAEELADWGVDVPGFDVGGDAGEAQEDEYEMPDEIHTDIVAGDLFEIGPHRLLCGDSTSVDSFERLLGGHKWDIVVTSPPYNQGDSTGDLLTNRKKKVSLYSGDFRDNLTSIEYFNFCVSVLSNLFLCKKEDHTLCWNVAYNSKSRDDYGKIVFSEKNPFKVFETLVWDKKRALNQPNVGIYSRRCEFVFVMSSSDKYKTSQEYGECRWNYLDIYSDDSGQVKDNGHEHRAAYPVSFPSKLLSDFSFSGDLVVDPFLGSGTTMVAAHQLGRKCYGMEIDPKYCQVIVDRMLKLDPEIEVMRNGVAYKNNE